MILQLLLTVAIFLVIQVTIPETVNRGVAERIVQVLASLATAGAIGGVIERYAGASRIEFVYKRADWLTLLALDVFLALLCFAAGLVCVILGYRIGDGIAGAVIGLLLGLFPLFMGFGFLKGGYRDNIRW